MTLQQSVQDWAQSASEELLRSMGHKPKKLDTTDLTRLLARPHEYAGGIIEFAGQTMTGSLLLLSDFEFFAGRLPKVRRLLSPRRRSIKDWLRVRDMCMELANQLLGRITNHLYRVGVVLEPMLPLAISDHAITVTVRARTEAPIVFSADKHVVFVWFEVRMNPGVSLESATTPSAATNPIGEGDFVEF